jgi:O-antigen/teichoic acid export membrane protein
MNEIHYFSGIVLAGGLILQTLILLFNRFVHKIKYPFSMVFYFYLKTTLMCMIPFVLLGLFFTGKLSGGLWFPILVIFIFMRFKNSDMIKKYKQGVSKEDFEEPQKEK